MVNVGDTGHDDEGEVVKEPASYGVQSRVVDLVNLLRVQVVVPALPADQVPDDDKREDAQAGGRAPVDQGVAEEEVLDNVVVPTTHAQTDVENGPLPPLRGQVVLLIGIGHKGVVGGHHGNVEVDEVVEEGRLVRARVARGNYIS